MENVGSGGKPGIWVENPGTFFAEIEFFFSLK